MFIAMCFRYPHTDPRVLLPQGSSRIVPPLQTKKILDYRLISLWRDV